jgi:signal recognition particle subunit SEC65
MKIYTLQYDHDWGSRYPRRISEWYFTEKPKYKDIQTILENMGLVVDKNHIRLKSIEVGFTKPRVLYLNQGE